MWFNVYIVCGLLHELQNPLCSFIFKSGLSGAVFSSLCTHYVFQHTLVMSSAMSICHSTTRGSVTPSTFAWWPPIDIHIYGSCYQCRYVYNTTLSDYPWLPQLHPDSDPSNPKLHGHFVELNKAYQVLSKEQSRKEYDLRIRHTNPGEFTPNSNHNIYRHRWSSPQ